jgi:hypothetical protein
MVSVECVEGKAKTAAQHSSQPSFNAFGNCEAPKAWSSLHIDSGTLRDMLM